MAHLNKVVRSVTAPGGLVCVDIVQAPDGAFGFAQYRRDPEDGRGWHLIGAPGDPAFDSFDTAWAAACRDVAWLAEAVG